MSARYLLCPGLVRSRNDDQLRCVTARELAHLYGVHMSDCRVMPTGGHHRDLITRRDLNAQVERGELVRLVPRGDEDYRLPGRAS